MKKLIWFLLGLLIPAIFVPSAHAIWCPNNTLVDGYNENLFVGRMVNTNMYNGSPISVKITAFVDNTATCNPSAVPGCASPTEIQNMFTRLDYSNSFFVSQVYEATCNPNITEPCSNGGMRLYGTDKVYVSGSGISCPADTDLDGVSDDADNCPGTPNGDEVDDFGCGLEPSTCTNGSLDGDETGIDCGGSCSASCVAFCPVDWTNIAGTCYSPEVNMINGNCPEGTTGQNLTDGTCIKSKAVTYASESYVDPDANDSLDWVFNDQNSPWVSNVTENTVDNGDGTSTTTTTTTTTINNYDGTTSTSTETTSTIINNTTGAVQSSSTTGSETVQTPSNVQGQEGDYDGTLTEGVDYPSESLFSDMLDGFNFGGAGTPLGDTSMEIVDPVCSITMGDYEISFCGEPFTGWFATFSTLLIAFAYLGAIYIVFRR